jgi:hypothetical protein
VHSTDAVLTQFTVKSLQRQASKASRDEVNEKAKLKKVRMGLG